MKTAVVGSRGFNDQTLFDSVMSEFSPSAIISGGADGADSMAAEYAKKNGIELVEFLPDWKQHGSAAGPIRNKMIIEAADMCIAFWDGKSRGTLNSINLAKKKGIPVYVY